MYCTVLNCIIIKLKVPNMYQILDSLVVRISACHVEGPGSIPGRGEIFSLQQKALLLQVRLELTTPA